MSQSYVSVSQPHHSSARDNGAFGPHIRSSAQGTGGSASSVTRGVGVVRRAAASSDSKHVSPSKLSDGGGGSPGMRVVSSGTAGAPAGGGRDFCLAGSRKPAGKVTLVGGPGDATATRDGPRGVPGGPLQALMARRHSWPQWPSMPHTRPALPGSTPPHLCNPFWHCLPLVEQRSCWKSGQSFWPL